MQSLANGGQVTTDGGMALNKINKILYHIDINIFYVTPGTKPTSLPSAPAAETVTPSLPSALVRMNGLNNGRMGDGPCTEPANNVLQKIKKRNPRDHRKEESERKEQG